MSVSTDKESSGDPDGSPMEIDCSQVILEFLTTWLRICGEHPANGKYAQVVPNRIQLIALVKALSGEQMNTLSKKQAVEKIRQEIQDTLDQFPAHQQVAVDEIVEILKKCDGFYVVEGFPCAKEVPVMREVRAVYAEYGQSVAVSEEPRSPMVKLREKLARLSTE
ncbi:hypothetical protein KIPB_006762 [Kipferlia bialata]|uniref:Uncharacterized protein n=1 Tax=Kipferlia bialata TaxID=797122 RepID=A0A9K3D044_9EUKA|nr:hypothetical protein KIPB_006762 [Kipferlia bialata]|eukprot:g6762.t1